MSRLFLVVVSLAVAYGQPTVFTGGVRNAASARSGLPNAGIAPGAWIVIQGRNLGLVNAARTDIPAVSLGGTAVQVSAGGQQFEVPLVHVSGGEILGRLPSGVPLGEASLTIQTAAGVSEVAKFSVLESSFGLFTTNQSDDEAAILRDLVSGGFFQLNGLIDAAKPGDELNLWGTGLGSENASLEVTIQDRPAEILARLAGENGIDRIRIRVPEADGCGLPLVLRTGETRSPVGLVSVAAAGRVCLDRNGFTAEDFEKARTSGGLKAAYLFLLRFAVPGAGSVFDIGFANFSRVSHELMSSFRSNWAQTVPGACYAANTDSQGNFSGQGQPGAEFFDDFYPFGETPLDAGPMINVRGPGGPQQMQKVDNGLYSGLFLNFTNPTVSYFSPGDYTLEGSGGEVGSFSANVKIGAPVVWQNFGQQPGAAISVPRGQDLKLTWTGGNPGDRVWIAAYAAELTGLSLVRAGVVSCYELAEKGSITVPASALQFLPATTQEGSGFIFLYSMAAPQRFQPSGGGLDAGYVLSLSYSAGLANFR